MKSNTLVPRPDDLPALAPDRLAAKAAEAVRELLAAAGFTAVDSRRDLGGHQRISLGRWTP